MSLIDLLFIPFIVFAVIAVVFAFSLIPMMIYFEAKSRWYQGHKVEATLLFLFVGSLALAVVGGLLKGLGL